MRIGPANAFNRALLTLKSNPCCNQWTSNGESFRITDLERLESETLPSYFRHSRFQSLVRQLNFYNVSLHESLGRPGGGSARRPLCKASPSPSLVYVLSITVESEPVLTHLYFRRSLQFRKVNRERNIWVYHHPLFHRDRPQDLGKLRRRTCPGFDGRKQKIARVAVDDEEAMETASTATAHSGGITTRNSTASSPAATTSTLVTPESSVVKVSRSPSPSSQISVESKPNIPFYRSISASTVDTRSSFHQEDTLSTEQLQDRAVHLRIVAQVSRDLNGICVDMSTKKQGQRGAVAEVFGLEKNEMHYSKIKCDLLTYDDEIVYDYEDEMEAAVIASGPKQTNDFTPDVTPATSSEAIIASIIDACHKDVIDRDVSSRVIRFLLTAHPQDPNLGSKITSILHHAVLRQEFNAYSKALGGSDLQRSWVNFALNKVCSLVTDISANNNLTKEDMDAVQRCRELWF